MNHFAVTKNNGEVIFYRPQPDESEKRLKDECDEIASCYNSNVLLYISTRSGGVVNACDQG